MGSLQYTIDPEYIQRKEVVYLRGYKNFDGTPHPGDLKHRVEIGYTEHVVSEHGYPQETDIVICRVWASATDAGNQHYRSADVMNT